MEPNKSPSSSMALDSFNSHEFVCVSASCTLHKIHKKRLTCQVLLDSFKANTIIAWNVFIVFHCAIINILNAELFKR